MFLTRLGAAALLAAVPALAQTTLVQPGAAAAPGPAAAPAPGTAPAGPRVDEPLVIGHRGASGYRPEHTLASYQLAIRLGADYIEPDLVATKDGVLVARHENEISGTTDVADHPEFTDRRTTKTIDGRDITGWFTEDFTLVELKTLRAVERLPDVRPDNTRYDGRFEVPTLDEVLALARAESRRTGRTIGVYPETKHPTYFDSIGLSLEEPLVAALKRHHLDRPNAEVIIQSFETGNLRDLDTMTRVPLAQLLNTSGAPYDLVEAGDSRTYRDLTSPENLDWIAGYADGVGVNKDLVLPRDAGTGATGEPSALVDDAHAEDLVVHVWTLRDENRFMATNFRIGTDPNAKGDAHAETLAFLEAGVDGIFSDHPDTTVQARDEWLAAGQRLGSSTQATR
jgi:glycerophosphoryl diester phosphodiesterase